MLYFVHGEQVAVAGVVFAGAFPSGSVVVEVHEVSFCGIVCFCICYEVFECGGVAHVDFFKFF